MPIWVQTYGQVAVSEKPAGIPNGWPARTRDTLPPDPLNWTEYADQAAYDAYVATQVSSYDAWLPGYQASQDAAVQAQAQASLQTIAPQQRANIDAPSVEQANSFAVVL
jgi:hypothetical protein